MGLGIGSILSGVLAYAVFVLTTRALGAHETGPVAVLWSYWGFAGAGITFPVQHFVARSAAAAGDESGVRADFARLWALVGAAAVLTGAGAWAAGERLFGAHAATFAVLVAVVTVGSGLMGVMRGLLSARGRFGAVGATLVAENGVRFAAALGVLLAGGESAPAYGWAIAAGFLAALGWPGAWRPNVSPGRPAGVWAFVAGASGGQLLGQIVLVGGPVLLAALGGSPADVTALFAALALLRAPFMVAIGQVSQLTGTFTGWVVDGDLDRMARVTRGALAVSVAAAVVGAPAGAWLGPWLVRVVFGGDVVVAGPVAAVLVAASVAALGNLVLSVALIAHARTAWAFVCWALALVPGAVVVALGPGEPLTRVAWCFLACESAALVLLFLAAARARRGTPPR